MVSKELSEAAVEINVILENTSPEIVSKIPKKFIAFLKEIASKNYIFIYDNTKSLEEQDIKPKTKGLLALIYKDFLCDTQEKQDYINNVSQALKNIEQKKREKYNADNIFINRVKEVNEFENIERHNLPIKSENKNILQKIVSFFKRLFGRR